MKNKYGIGLFAAALIVILLISCAYQYTFKLAKERAEKEMEAETAAEEYPSVAADGQAFKEDCYYLMEVNGYIVVYLSDKKTAYEYTDISYDRLPANLRNEIRNGKYIASPEELYGFLENYSS